MSSACPLPEAQQNVQDFCFFWLEVHFNFLGAQTDLGIVTKFVVSFIPEIIIRPAPKTKFCQNILVSLWWKFVICVGTHKNFTMKRF